jgi:hypothetical protein
MGGGRPKDKLSNKVCVLYVCNFLPNQSEQTEQGCNLNGGRNSGTGAEY